MSPYVVTTTRWAMQDSGDHEEVVSRRAVATLDEVRGEVEEEVFRITGEPVAADFPDEGGTVGPLPDGSVIEVEPVDISDLAYRADFRWQTRRASEVATEIIAAFNQREATR